MQKFFNDPKLRYFYADRYAQALYNMVPRAAGQDAED